MDTLASKLMRPWNKGLRTETAAFTDAGLVNSSSARNVRSPARRRPFQSRYREQASCVRFGPAEDRGHLLRSGGPGSSNRDSDEDGQTDSVRNHGGDAAVSRAPLGRSLASGHRLSFPKPVSDTAPYLDATVRRIAHRWIKSIGLDDRAFGTHSLRRTKLAQIYRKAGI